MQGGNKIGTLTASKTVSGNKTEFSMTSEVEKRMIMKLEVYEKHTASFTNDKLTGATVIRKVNGKVKVDKKIICTDASCTITSEGETSSIQQQPVVHSVLNIYFFEPEKVKEIFSDNFEKMIALQNMGNHAYKLSMPDGNTAYYYYANGICSKVKVDHKLYDLEFVLVN